ncbi:MAG TPA: BlaI/MecI/CopY family transcriptional regulator [Vicinamibacterales bacterium]
MFKGLWGSRWRRTERDPLGAALGSLERQVMGIVWDGTAFTVRDVHARLARPVAYTTVMTTLDRLFKKGFVARTREGRAFVYTAARSRADVEAAMASGVVGGLLSQGDAMPILSNLVDAVSAQDGGAELLDALESLVRQRRREIEEQDR